jgi:hypothetical protein
MDLTPAEKKESKPQSIFRWKREIEVLKAKLEQYNEKITESKKNIMDVKIRFSPDLWNAYQIRIYPQDDFRISDDMTSKEMCCLLQEIFGCDLDDILLEYGYDYERKKHLYMKPSDSLKKLGLKSDVFLDVCKLLRFSS